MNGCGHRGAGCEQSRTEASQHTAGNAVEDGHDESARHERKRERPRLLWTADERREESLRRLADRFPTPRICSAVIL